MLTTSQKNRLSSSFQCGTLRTLSVSPTGERSWKKVTLVSRASVGVEPIIEVKTGQGSSTLTGGHRVFTSPTEKLEAEKLISGSIVLGVSGPKVITGSKQTSNREFMYDMTVEDWHNFVLHKSGIIVSNSPDRNYKFRPPAHEETVDQFSKVFGYIWESEELAQFIDFALDMVIAAPPRTPFNHVDHLMQQRPEWRTLLLMGAQVHAIGALQANWIADEFDYSIGGVSLNLDKSSKYESLKQGAADQFDKQLERAKATVKYIKGLQQPKYGAGIRSSFGPYVGRGVLAPSKFLGV